MRVAPGHYYNIHKTETGEVLRNRNIFFTDKQFFSVFTFPLLVGDVSQNWGREWLVISEKAALKMYGKENPVGQTLLLKTAHDDEDVGKHGLYTYFLLDNNCDRGAIEKAIPQIIEKNFHFQPLYESVQPMYIIYDMPFVSYSMLVRYREGKRQEVLTGLRKLYEEQFTNSDFEYWEYNFSQLYNKDIALVRLINIFTLIAILIGGMGVLALSMFMAESRQREIALRKVNGAGTWQIMWLLYS